MRNTAVKEGPVKTVFRILLALFFIIGGILHFLKTPLYVKIMPPWLPCPEELVYISGVFEVLGGLGVLIPRLRRWAGFGLIALSIAVFPANVQMALNYYHAQGLSLATLLLLLRLPLQIVIVLWIYWCTRSSSRVPLF